MWVRKRIEISTPQMLRGMARCFLPGRREATEDSVRRLSGDDNALICLSVRTGFDLLAQSAGWEPGSEIIMSGLTIPDMPRILRHHHLEPVPVDIDLETLAPDIEQIKRSINARTRAIVVAHLFGGLCDIDPIIDLAREHNLVVIEDCAQAYVGHHFVGNRRADVSMFSFGPIKTNTALGGALFHVRRPQLREAITRQYESMPLQGRLTFFQRLGKYAFVRLLSTRLVTGSVYRFMAMLGRNHDGIATNMARGFAGSHFFEKIRKQPSTPLLRVLEEKLKRFDRSSIQKRTQRGLTFLESLKGVVESPGSRMHRPTFWVMSLLVESPQELIEQLWKAGFDATAHSSLVTVGSEREFEYYSDDSSIKAMDPGNARDLPNADFLLNHVVYVAFDLKMPEAELERMARTIIESGATKPARRPRPASTAEVVAHAEPHRSQAH